MSWTMEMEDEGFSRTYWSRPSLFVFENLSDKEQKSILSILKKIDAKGLRSSDSVLKKLDKKTFVFKSGNFKRVVIEWNSTKKEFKVLDILDRRAIASFEKATKNA